MTNRKNFKARDYSKSPLKAFTWNSNGGTVNPNFSFNAVLQLIENDPVARGAINHFVDKCMEGDYSIIRKEDRAYDRIAELRLEEQYMFRTKVLRKIFLQGKLYNNVFLEIVRELGGKTKSINVLDSTNLDVETEPNGDLISCRSKISNQVTGEYAKWNKKDIVWLKFGDRTNGWAPVDMRALWDNLLLKSYVNRYVTWLWKTGQYRIIYKFQKASNQDITDFLTYARKNDDQYNIPFVSKGELSISLLRDMKEITYLNEQLKYIDSQTLILLRVPPIDAGIPDASGRSNADAQSNNIESTVVSTKKLVQDYINFDLFPKINKSTVMLKFGPMNRFSFKQLIEVAASMNGMGLSNEVIGEYLMDNGVFFEAKKLFKEIPTDQFSVVSENEKNVKGEGEGNQPQDEVTTREDQLKKV
jgi:hypothetical protein